MAYINVIDYEQSGGELRDIYDNLIATRGKLADVHMIQSLNPTTIVSHMKLYLDIMFGQSPLKRYQREMLGVIVSVANNCAYCKLHHGEALHHYWKDENKVKALCDGAEDVELSLADGALCDFARAVTLQPSQPKSDKISELKKLGFEDRAILDATLVISYFNFVNRMVMTLGVEINDDEISGYNY